MKSKSLVLPMVMISILLLTACQKKQENLFVLPEIPEGYVADKTLYLAEGEGIYAFVEDKAFDYGAIGGEIFRGNAEAVKAQFEEKSKLAKNPKEYAAIQNILGITEVYLGNYVRAFQYFNDTIDYINKKKVSEKEKILTVLYNNAGAVTVNLSKNAVIDKRLGKASELCEEPYMALVVAVNQTGRAKLLSPVKEYGEMIVRAKKLIECEEQITDSPNFVLYLAVKYMAVGYALTKQENKAIEVLDKYIPQIPDEPEYNLCKASLLNLRGYCWYALMDYERSINEFQSAIELAEKTVNENSKQIAIPYERLGVCYTACRDWETGLKCFEKAVPAFEGGLAQDKAILYWNAAQASYGLGQYEKAKRYLLKAYINDQMLIEDLGVSALGGYGGDIKSDLYVIYQSEKDRSVSFDEWLERESEQYLPEEKKNE